MEYKNITMEVIKCLKGVHGFTYLNIDKYKDLVGLDYLNDKIVYSNKSTIKINSNIDLDKNDFTIFKLKLQHIRLDANENDCIKFVTQLFTHMIEVAKHFSNNVSLFINTINIINIKDELVLELFYNLFLGYSNEYDLKLNVELDNIMNGNYDFLEQHKEEYWEMCPYCGEECECGYDCYSGHRDYLFRYNDEKKRYENKIGDITYDYTDIRCLVSNNLLYKLSIYGKVEYLNQEYSVGIHNGWDDGQDKHNACLFNMLEYGHPYLTLNLKI